MRDGDFSLKVSERALYGATVTSQSLDTGETLTIARTKMTAVDAVREIVGLLDGLDGRYRVVSVSTPNSIERDLYANRVSLAGRHEGTLSVAPEHILLGRIKRPDMLHPSMLRMSKRNTTMPRGKREAMFPDSETGS